MWFELKADAGFVSGLLEGEAMRSIKAVLPGPRDEGSLRDPPRSPSTDGHRLQSLPTTPRPSPSTLFSSKRSSRQWQRRSRRRTGWSSMMFLRRLRRRPFRVSCGGCMSLRQWRRLFPQAEKSLPPPPWSWTTRFLSWNKAYCLITWSVGVRPRPW